MIYWVYCDYSLLEAPWSKLLALLDLIIEYMFNLLENMLFNFFTLLCLIVCFQKGDIHVRLVSTWLIFLTFE